MDMGEGSEAPTIWVWPHIGVWDQCEQLTHHVILWVQFITLGPLPPHTFHSLTYPPLLFGNGLLKLY